MRPGSPGRRSGHGVRRFARRGVNGEAEEDIDAAVEEMKAQLMKATEVEASLQPDAEATEMDECPSAGVKRRR